LLAQSAIGREGLREGVALEDVLRSHVARLGDEARRLLEVLSLAARPLPVGLARRAAGLAEGERAAIAALRAGRVARTHGPKEEDLLELDHDQIGQAVLRDLSAPRISALHRALAVALEGSTGADPEILAVHWRGAGDPAAAGKHAIDAARRAEEALAFDR